MLTIGELIAKLQELPNEWQAYATKSGSSIEVSAPAGDRYGYVFTDERPTRLLINRRAEDARRYNT